MSKMTEKSCPICNKSFKNLRLHIVKVHEDVKVIMRPIEDENEVFYCGTKLSYASDYSDDEMWYLLYQFPKSMTEATGYDGITLVVEIKTNKYVNCEYYKWVRETATCKGKISEHRIKILEADAVPAPVPVPVPAPVVNKPLVHFDSFNQFVSYMIGTKKESDLKPSELCALNKMWKTHKATTPV